MNWIQGASQAAIRLAAQKPVTAGAVVVGVGVFVAPAGLVAAPIVGALNLVGFGAGGIVAG